MIESVKRFFHSILAFGANHRKVLAAFAASLTLFALSLLLWCALLWDGRAAHWREASAALRARTSSSPVPLTPPQDFVTRLPAFPRIESFLDDARRRDAGFVKGPGVQVMTASIRSTVSESRPSFVDLQFEVRGQYPALKDWVNELQGRYWEAALVAMDLSATPDADAGLTGSMQWRLYARRLEVLPAGQTASLGASR